MSSANGSVSRSRLSAKGRRLLRKKRGRLRLEAEGILTDYQNGAATAQGLRKLQASVRSLHHQLATSAGGTSPVTVALLNLDASLGHLLQAQHATDGAETTRQFQAGLTALSEAYRHAHAAGHDWAL